MNKHIHLTLAIRAKADAAHLLRRQAAKFIAQGRKLRAKAHWQQDPRRDALLTTAEKYRREGLALRVEADSDNADRRYLHLMAAMLNGRT